MPSIGPLEILFVGVIALIVFGPQKLPEMARTIGRTLAEFRRQAAEVRAEFESGMTLDDEPAMHPEPPEVSPPPAASDEDPPGTPSA